MTAPLITSRQNQRIKDAAKLRDRRQREKQGRILIDGVREIGHAVDAGVAVVEVFVCDELLTAADGPALLQTLFNAGVDMARVTPEVFDKITFGERTDGVVAAARTPSSSLPAIRLPPCPIVAVLEGVEKPGNVGAVARSADAAGVHALVAADGRTDLFNPNAVRASLGVLFSLEVAESTAEETLSWLRGQRIPIYVARPDAGRLYTAVDYSTGGAMVLGSEIFGVSDIWQGDGITPIRLPMLGAADSLNVSVAAAVLFYEALRQREKI